MIRYIEKGDIFRIDGAEQAILREVSVGRYRALLELDNISMIRIGHAAVDQVDLTQRIVHLIFRYDVLDPQIFLRVRIIGTRLAGDLGHLHVDHQRGLGQRVGNAKIVRFHGVFLDYFRLRQERHPDK